MVADLTTYVVIMQARRLTAPEPQGRPPPGRAHVGFRPVGPCSGFSVSGSFWCTVLCRSFTGCGCSRRRFSGRLHEETGALRTRNVPKKNSQHSSGTLAEIRWAWDVRESCV